MKTTKLPPTGRGNKRILSAGCACRALLAMACFLPVRADAQPVAHSFEDLQKTSAIRQGDTIQVTNQAGKRSKDVLPDCRIPPWVSKPDWPAAGTFSTSPPAM
jgi:hypothetical protein